MNPIAWRTTRTAAALLLSIVAAPAWAATPAPLPDDLLRLVPADVAAVVLVSDLAHAGRQFLGSPAVQQFQSLPAVQEWKASPDFRTFLRARKIIEYRTGMPLDRAIDELFGEAVLLALRPGTEGRPDASLFLVRARSPEVLGRLDRPHHARRHLIIERREIPYGGATILERTIRHPAPRPDPARPAEIREYSSHLGRLLVMSNQQQMVEQVIDLAGSPDGRGSLATQAAFQQARRRVPERPLALGFIAPRAFDCQVEAATASLGTMMARQGLGNFLRRSWDGIDAIVVAAEVTPVITIHAYTHFDPTRLPAPGCSRQPGGSPARMLDRVPAAAVAVGIARLDLAALDRQIEAVLPPEGRPTWRLLRQAASGMLLGRDLRTGVEPLLGPGVAVYALPAAAGPLQLVAAVELRPDRQVPPLPAALDNLIRTAAAIRALTASNPPHCGGEPIVPVIRDMTVDGVRLTVVAHEPQPGQRLAYAATDHYLVAASSPGPIVAFLRDAGPRFAASEPFRTVRAKYFDRASDLIYLDTGRFSRFLRDGRQALIDRLVRRDRIDAEEADRRLETITGLAGLFRAVYAARTPDPDGHGVHYLVGLAPAQPEAGQD